MTQPDKINGFPGPGQLYRVTGDRSDRAPVLLTHGTFSDASTVAPLAGFLAEAGRPVYIIEWRGRGGRPGRFGFEDLAAGEIASAIAAMPEPAHLVAHSGGGLAMCFALLDPAARAGTRSLTMLATQGTHLKDAARRDYLGVRVAELVGRMRGHWSAKAMKLGPCNETSMLLSEWFAFNRARRVTTRDGRALYELLRPLDLPVLALAGAADTVIARPEGCAALAQAFGARAKYHLCRAETDGEDFTHSRLIRSRAAARSVWPRIAQFIADHPE